MDPRGEWSVAGFEFSVVDGPLLRYTEAPEGYESPMIDLGGGRYRVESGPFAGGEVDIASRTVGGVVELERLDRPAGALPGSGTAAPSFTPTDAERTGFERLWSNGDHDGQPLAPESVVRFVQWLMSRDEVIFHGSNVGDIDEFQPVRRSMELEDRSGRGNRGAVYGTHDGLWAMFFAVIDRDALEGSIRNGVSRYTSRHDGTDLDLYHFSLNQESLDRRPYTAGTLYLLPRAGFERLALYPGGPMSNEWACEHPVRPLARLVVSPSEFPFLDRIGVHDDGPILELGRLADQVYGGIVAVTRLEAAFEIVTTASPEIIDAFIRLSSELYPDVSRVATPTDTATRILMTGPPAFVHGIERRFADWLD